MKNRKGFTLIEMLIVIAIIAILVAIIVPTVGKATSKAKAAADAANLRTIQGQGNTFLAGGDFETALGAIQAEAVNSKTFPNAHVYVAYGAPGFVKIYFVDSGKYYGIEYFSELAQSAESSQSTAKPTFSGYTVEWYDLTAKSEVN